MYQKQNKIFAQLGKALVKQRLTPSTNKTVFSSARLHLAHELQHSYNERILIERTEFHHQKPVSLIPFKGILSTISGTKSTLNIERQHFKLKITLTNPIRTCWRHFMILSRPSAVFSKYLLLPQILCV